MEKLEKELKLTLKKTGYITPIQLEQYLNDKLYNFFSEEAKKNHDSDDFIVFVFLLIKLCNYSNKEASIYLDASVYNFQYHIKKAYSKKYEKIITHILQGLRK